jgi:hypothetical protein
MKPSLDFSKYLGCGDSGHQSISQVISAPLDLLVPSRSSACVALFDACKEQLCETRAINRWKREELIS